MLTVNVGTVNKVTKLKDQSYGKYKYILYRPSKAVNLPLIVVLHGSDEVGTRLSKLKKREPYISLKKGAISPNAVILMPQLPNGSWGKSAVSLKKLIDHVVKLNDCDANRVTITGHSLGGAGVMDMLLKYPNYFAAAASLSPCKVYKADKLKDIKHVPLWLFYGEREGKFGKYARLINSRLDSVGGDVKLTCVKGKGHAIQSCWVEKKYGLFEWLSYDG